MRGLLVVSMAVLLGACVSSQPPARGVTEEEAAANRARPFVEGEAALARYNADPGCQNADSAQVETNIAELQDLVGSFNLTGIRDLENTARQRHTALAFGYADSALGKGCLDEAEATYRELVTFYVGSAYDGIRDRATIGIDDVRTAR